MKSTNIKNKQVINSSCCRPILLLQNSSNYLSKNNAILCLSFLLLLLPRTIVTAQSGQPAGPQQQYPYARFSPSMAFIIVLVITILFFMGFFSIYVRQCGGGGGTSIRPALSLRSRRAAAAAAARGLDAEVIETFPMFQYSEVKTLKIGKGALECAVCLNEFEDDETLRLIPKCDHVFHPECIDAWLGSHLTCPVCRANLVPLPGDSTHFHPPESQLAEPDNTDNQENGNAVSIVVEEHHEVNNVEGVGQLPPRPPQEQPVVRNISFNQNRPPRSNSVRTRLFGKFRSHSTGHSLVQRGENLERFTLRLPEEVRREMINRAVLKRTGSLARLPKASSSRRGYRTGESSSSSRGRSYGILEKPDRLEVRSDRWIFSMAPPFFSRASSVRSPKVVADNGGGSTTSRTPKGGLSAVKLPLNCSESKGSDETGLVSADSGRLPV